MKPWHQADMSKVSLAWALLLVCACAQKTPPAKNPPSAQPASKPAAAAPASEIVGEEVNYQADGVSLKGFLAYDKSVSGARPGIVIVHEWWGHNPYVRRRARQLAELGYTALAIDMYGEGKQAAHPDDAKKFMMEVFNNLPMGQRRFEAGLKVLKEHQSVQKDKIAALGYCFGGAVALHMGRAGVDLKGIASFHGNLSTKVPAETGALKGKVIAFTGAEDPFVPLAQVKSFEEEMKNAKANYQLISYPGVKHSFTVKEATEKSKALKLPLVYDEKADKDSFEKLQTFLKDVFSAS